MLISLEDNLHDSQGQRTKRLALFFISFSSESLGQSLMFILPLSFLDAIWIESTHECRSDTGGGIPVFT